MSEHVVDVCVSITLCSSEKANLADGARDRDICVKQEAKQKKTQQTAEHDREKNPGGVSFSRAPSDEGREEYLSLYVREICVMAAPTGTCEKLPYGMSSVVSRVHLKVSVGSERHCSLFHEHH